MVLCYLKGILLDFILSSNLNIIILLSLTNSGSPGQCSFKAGILLMQDSTGIPQQLTEISLIKLLKFLSQSGKYGKSHKYFW